MQILKSCAFVVAVLSVFVASDCFLPDGRNATNLFPCYPDEEVSHCCREGDACISNGLCFSPGLGSLVRRGCTDSTWKSDACRSICMIEPFRTAEAALTRCGSYNAFCCGDDQAAHECCEAGANNTLSARVPSGEVMCGVKLGPADASTSSTSSGTTTPTCAASSRATPASSSNSLKTERNALIGLTAAFGSAAVVAALLAFHFRRKRNDKERERATLVNEKDQLNNEKTQLNNEKTQLSNEKTQLSNEKNDLRRTNDALAKEKLRLQKEVHDLKQKSLPPPMRTEFNPMSNGNGVNHR